MKAGYSLKCLNIFQLSKLEASHFESDMPVYQQTGTKHWNLVINMQSMNFDFFVSQATNMNVA